MPEFLTVSLIYADRPPLVILPTESNADKYSKLLPRAKGHFRIFQVTEHNPTVDKNGISIIFSIRRITPVTLSINHPCLQNGLKPLSEHETTIHEKNSYTKKGNNSSLLKYFCTETKNVSSSLKTCYTENGNISSRHKYCYTEKRNNFPLLKHFCTANGNTSSSHQDPMQTRELHPDNSRTSFREQNYRSVWTIAQKPCNGMIFHSTKTL